MMFCGMFLLNIPRGCGGEPVQNNPLAQNAMIFPADAGVNLLKEGNIPSEIHIPRGCGGEPKELVEQARLNTIFPADAGVNLKNL